MTKTLLVATAVTASILGVTPPSASSAAQRPHEAGTSAAAGRIPGVHYLRPAHAPGKCVTVHGWETSTSAKIDQWTCQGQQNQRWNFLQNGFKYWIKSELSIKCLDAGDIKKGRKVIQWPCKNSLNQAWNPVYRGGNRYQIVVGGTQCLDVEGGSKSNGARLILWKCKNVPNQLFYLN
ncbi:RICIN domain-containing protein [Streptomyces halstedii]|uniref:Ricin-type beta-trefoil lectin domain protein n=1 Tax=Streptomyces halstedii TaxID=1944 RepID=A0A6N9UEK3_STRHA|nr:RICIN domain-containing protein [Streptomyces halstedii]NEA20536.1 ricin-type beta-trefoil lectin domain protein [Streptomyces halstedii]